MAGGRRAAARNPRSPPPTAVSSAALQQNNSRNNSSRDDELPVPHILPLPDIPHDSLLAFECIMFVYCLVGLGLQYLNLYRTVWWLPHSYNNSAVNFYLIDGWIAVFGILVFCRRLLWLLTKIFLNYAFQVPPNGKGIVYAKYLYIALVVSVLLYLAYLIVQTHSLISTLYLLYPCILYIAFFGFALPPFVDLVPVSTGKVKIYRDKGGVTRTNLGGSGGVPPAPDFVRTEANVTIKDSQLRFKQAILNGFLVAYYGGFIPCVLCQPYLHYETWWVSLHTFALFVGSFIFHLVQVFSASYTNLLHRCVLSLGCWTKLTGRVSPTFFSSWTSGTTWPAGTVVRYGKDIYRAEGVVNAAEPGNNKHYRYYWLFSDPSLTCGLALLVHVGLISLQFYLLVRSTVWYHLISQGLLLFIHYYSLFKLGRDYLVLRKVHQAEQYLQAKSATSTGQ